MTAPRLYPDALERQGARRPPPMMVATRSFTATYGGETVRISAGRDRVVPEHELVVRDPHRFKLETAQRQKVPPRRRGEKATPKPKRRSRGKDARDMDAGATLPRIAGALGPFPPLPELGIARLAEDDAE